MNIKGALKTKIKMAKERIGDRTKERSSESGVSDRNRLLKRIFALSLPLAFFSLILFLSFPAEVEADGYLKRGVNWVFNKGADSMGEAIASLITSMCYAILTLCAAITALAGKFFDFAVEATILNLNENLGGNLGPGIQDAWATFRDLANMLFIFVLLYISIATILQLTGADTKRMLKNVIIVALLINFSMFFTHVVIDFTNAFAIAFYNASLDRTALEAAASGGSFDESIVYPFMNSGYLPSAFSAGGIGAGYQQLNDLTENYSALFGLTFVGSAFYLIFAFVLVAGAILLVSRFIMFILLIILSPLAFVSNILPQTSGMFNQWFRSLTNNALFAPIFMALIWASLVVITSLDLARPDVDGGLGSVMSGTTEGGTDHVQMHEETGEIIFSIVIAAGMLIASIVIAKSLSIQGGAQASRIGSKWGRYALGGATVGAVAYGGRRVVGGTAARVRDSDRVANWKTSDNRWARAAGNMAYSASDKTAKSSFDVRVTGATGSALGAAGGKGGYDAVQKRKADREVARMKSLEPSEKRKGDAEILLREAERKLEQEKKKAEGKKDKFWVKVAEEEVEKRQKELERLNKVGNERKTKYTENTRRNISGSKRGQERRALQKELAKTSQDKQTEAILEAIKKQQEEQK